MKKLILIAASLIIAQTSHAGFIFAPALTYFDREVTDNANPTQESSYSAIDLKLGYTFDYGLYIGGMYSLVRDKTLSDTSDFHFGPSVGYYNNGFFAVGTVYVYGERDVSVGGGKYASISGYQIDLAYAIPITKTFSVGPQITYQTVKYTDFQNASGISTVTDYQWKGMTPYIGLFFIF